VPARITQFGAGEVRRYASGTGFAVSMADVVYPAQTLIIADSDWTRSTNDYGWSNSWMIRRTPHVSRFIPARHNEGANIIYCDGHAKWSQVPLDPAYTGDGEIPLTKNPPGVLWLPNGSA